MQKQITCDSKSIDIPLCINDLHVLMAIFKQFKVNYKRGLYFSKHFVYLSLGFFMVQLLYYVLHYLLLLLLLLLFQFRTRDER